MSALYFQEHKELVSMRETRKHEVARYDFHKPYERTRDAKDLNHIQNPKFSQHSSSRKTVKEKGSHKTTAEFAAPTEPAPAHTTATAHAHAHNLNLNLNNYVNKLINSVASAVQAERAVTRKAEVVGGACSSYAVNTNNELDPECQSPCIDPPQTYDNQDDRSKTDKELNDTYAGPLETPTGDKFPNIPVTPEKNHTESLKADTEPLRNENESKMEDNMPENNFLDNKPNVTENGSRMKRDVRRKKRDERSSEEGQNESEECETVRVGLQSPGKPPLNASLFSDAVCAHSLANFSYEVPLSLCLTHKQVHLTFSSTRLQEIRVCEQCNAEASGSCHAPSERSERGSGRAPSERSERGSTRLARVENVWAVKLILECHVDRTLRLRATFQPYKKDICTISEPKTPFIEYNIRIHRDCRN